MSGDSGGRSMSSSKLFKALFKGRELHALPFIPLAHDLAAKVGQVDRGQMWADSAAMVNSLLSTKELCGFDALTTSVHITGCESGQTAGGENADCFLLMQERADAAVEVTQRLKHMLKDNTVLGCMVAGPLTLSGGTLKKEEDRFTIARDYLLQFVKRMGENRIDLFMLYENMSTVFENDLTKYVEQTRPLWNALRYYDAQPILALRSASAHVIETLAPEVSGIAITDNFFELDLEWLSRISDQKKICIGLPLPEEVFKGSLDILETILSRIAGHFNRRRVFLIPSGEIPSETDICNIQDCIKCLDNI